MLWKIKEIVQICQGELYSGNDEVIIDSFSNDTRTIKDNALYIGIKGENFDGNLFYEEAFNKGAVAVIIDKEMKSNITKNDKVIILVDNPKMALASLAEAWLHKKQIPVVAITGSVGKTSTRDMLYAILNKKFKAFKPIKNYNNDIGLPMSILNIKDHEIAILEMGMNNLGEISFLSKTAKPDIAIITNVLAVHIEYLKTMENILKAKLEILDGLNEHGTLIINNDNSYLHDAKINFNQIFTCGINNDSDLKVIQINENTFKIVYQDIDYEFEHNNLTLPLIQNLLLAIAAGILLEVPISDIRSAIKEFELSEGRLENIKLNNNILLINDAYNANCESMKNAIDYLIKQEGNRKIAILGNILELGDFSQKLHSEVGEYLNEHKIDYLITIGDAAKYIFDKATIQEKTHFDTKENLYTFLKNFIKPGDVIILKASNGENFAEIVDFFKNNYLQT